MSGAITLIGIYPPPYGGVSIHIKRLKLALQQRGLEVAVLAQPDSDSDEAGVFPTRMGPTWYIHQLLRQDASVLHYHTSGLKSGKLLLLSILAFLGKPVVVTLHSFRNEPRTPFLKFRSTPPIALRAFNHIICVGPAVRDKVVRLGVHPSRTSVIPSYLPPILNDHDRRQIHPDVDRFLGSHQPVITASAWRLCFFKGEDLYGLDLCVELCRQLIRDYPRLGFVFALPDIGNEDYYASILQRISDYGLNDHFCFSHTPAEYWPIIERSSLLVRPTNTDSFGVSVAEAIDLGVPAIASDVCQRAPGTILFRKRDFQDLLEKTRMVLDNLGEYKRRLADYRMGRTDTVDRIIAVYRSVMEARGRGIFWPFRWQYYLNWAQALPPRVVLCRVTQKLSQGVRKWVGRWSTQLFDTHISDAQLRAALAPPLQGASDLLARLRSDGRPAFFIAPGQADVVPTVLRRYSPKTEARTIAAADKVCDQVFDLLGFGPTSPGERIDWHRDFKAGYRWGPRTYYADVRYNLDIGHDIKVPWELSRCQHFATLGKAYWYTGGEKYAREFTAQVTDWIEHNPPQFGVNWKCTMDVAIRVVNWLWGYYFFQDSPSLTDEFRLEFFKSLLTHGRHIISNLESGIVTSNHYLSDLVGLVYLGIMLPEFKEAKRWREKGLGELWSEMDKQVYPDGVDFEASISYHRLVTELFLSPIILCQLNGIPVPEEVMERLEKMLEFVMYYTKPDGAVPLIGDADNGRLHRLNTWVDPEREWVDHRYLLAIGAVLFEREDFAQAAGDQWEEALWLLGEQAIVFKEQFDQKNLSPPRLESKAFTHAGIHVMRHGDLYMIIDAGPNGQNGNGGHAHNDTLSFELYAYGKTFICDPGAYVYTADYRWRNRFRSTAYHNTIVVDGQEMNRFDERRLFRIQNDAIPKVHRWEVSDQYDFFDGEHSGYQRLTNPVTHRRQVYFDKAEGFWIVRDLLTGEGRHQFDLYFHFAPMGIVFDKEDPLAVRTECGEETNLAMVAMGTDGLSGEIVNGWVSYSYGIKVKAPIVRYSKVAEAPTEFITVLFPSKEPRAVEDIKEIALLSLNRVQQWEN